jgi:3-oxoacyl-[acyl-carrier protein] reductase
VNAVAPGVIDTDMSHFTNTEAARGLTLGIQLLQQISTPQDVTDVVAFLASDAAGWLTGVSIPVDGGSKLYAWRLHCPFSNLIPATTQ